MNVTAGRVSADSTKVRRLSGQAPIKSCARPARSDPGVDGQIHKKTAANGVRVISGHAGAGAESIISVYFQGKSQTKLRRITETRRAFENVNLIWDRVVTLNGDHPSSSQMCDDVVSDGLLSCGPVGVDRGQ